MAWGGHKSNPYKENPAAGPHTLANENDPGVPVEHRETLYYRNPNTQYYPGFETQGYQRPIPAPSDEGHRHGGVVTNVGHHVEDQTLTDRGTESHGVDVDSKVGPKDQPEARTHNKRDNVHEILPDDENVLDEEYPVPVRIVRDEPIEDVRTVIGSYSVSGLTPVRVLGRDRKRTNAVIGTVGAVTGTAVIVGGQNGNPAYGFAIGATSVQPLVTKTTEELWVSGLTSSDAFTVAVFQERTTNADPHHAN